ncbi:hypothetical protein GCM10011611_12780 [Aliidongia dinghuensis]|uniref:YIP1 family protein n=1 Tax=Aliidongia dinghuensis TaxID=1867774 RepID=A0A8J2YR95_9PROT|nr:hypothetical protein [Aliidongia dinghuensis]GGF08752.1 hypothetical protein GCM10011611_12780 [Aliidongia dinghuensis]
MNPPDAAPVRSETVRSLAGALRFLKFDLRAIAAFDPSTGAAIRSFMAALYGVPIYAGLLALDLLQAEKQPADLGVYALVQLIAYIARTAAFPLAVLGLARILGHVEQWPLFVTAMNWFGLVQITVQLAATILDQSGILGATGSVLAQVVLLYLLTAEAFVAWAALSAPALAGFAVVLLDIVIGVGIDKIATFLL